jgi:hypothetical protein
MKGRWIGALALLCALQVSCGGQEEALHSAGTNLVLGDSSYEGWTGRAMPKNISEQERVRTHLAYVEQTLRLAPTDHLDEAGRRARHENLDRLRGYWVAGQFPHNDGHPDERRPVFVDDQGAVCAVGHLIAQDLGREAIEPIARGEKYDFIDQVDHPALARWQQTSGLSMRELAMIQPSYGWREPRVVYNVEADIERARKRAQRRMRQCTQDTAHTGPERLMATVTWDHSGRVVAVGVEHHNLAPALESCLRQTLERGMALRPFSSYSSSMGQHLTRRLHFSLPMTRPPAPPAVVGPADLDQGLQAIQVRAASCFAHMQGAGSRQVPMTVAINSAGQVAWARIAPQHLLLAPMDQGNVQSCVLQAARGQTFASFQGPLLEAHLHIPVPEVHP